MDLCVYTFLVSINYSEYSAIGSSLDFDLVTGSSATPGKVV